MADEVVDRVAQSVAEMGVEVEEVGKSFTEACHVKYSSRSYVIPACFWQESSDVHRIL
ncbi:hypothetical protein UNDYM_1798 [Undibacterium sp. YM2]|nr:hypothetical protein UNDYM_1798 [Undibacterium sp. YM2]